MAVVFGIDEAGDGPRLGPLVIAASGFEVTGEPREFDFWDKLQRVVSRQRDGRGADARLHVADSKQVYSPSAGLANLERSVLTFLALAGHQPQSFQELWRVINDTTGPGADQKPFVSSTDMAFPLPLAARQSEIDAAALRVADEFEKQDVHLHSIQIDVVGVERFNRLTRFHGSKGSTLTQVTRLGATKCLLTTPKRTSPSNLG